MTINDISQEYFRMKKCEVRLSSVSVYIAHYVNHIKPDEIAEMPINEISKIHLQTFIYRLRDKGLRKRTIQNVVIIVNMMRQHAEEMHDIPIKTIKKLKYPQEEHQEVEIMSPTDMKNMFKYILEHPDRFNISFILCLQSGMRIGELCAMQWKDIDFSGKILSVNKTIERVYMNGLLGGKRHTELIINPPKTNSSKRTIPLTPALVMLLRKFRGLSPEDYYVVGNSAKPVEPRRLRIYFDSILKKLNMPHMKFHALRHSFASMMITNGTDVVTTSKLLGHSDVSTTLNVYSHSNEGKKRDALSLINKKLKLL